jgi:hypothetical protein
LERRWSINDERAQQLRSSLDSVPDEGFDRLARSLDRTDRGFDSDLRTPFSSGASRQEVISQLEAAIGHTDYPEMEAIDEHERSKVGPISLMDPYSLRESDVLEFGHQTFSADEVALDQATEIVRNLLPIRSLRVADFFTAFGLMPKDTSLGLPWVTRDRGYVESYYQRATHLSSPAEIFPCILYWRGQAAGPNKTKQRVVFGFDHAETIFGATILYPVLAALRRIIGFSAWNGDVFVDEAITSLLRSSQGRQIISMDYSGFDHSLHKDLLSHVDDILSSWFADPGPSRVALLAMISNTVPLVVPWTVELLDRVGGMPSGSVLTNLRDTIANLIAGVYVGIRSKSSLMRYEVLGDDSVFVFTNDMDQKTLTSLVGELGLESNPDKQFVSTTSVHYLQRWHSTLYTKDGLHRGVRSPYRAMSGVLGYERFRGDWSKYLDSARWIMQFENLKNDPRFELCVRFLFENDSVLNSGMDPETIFKRAGGAEVISSTLNIASFPFNVQNPEDVSVFETTRVLRTLS